MDKGGGSFYKDLDALAEEGRYDEGIIYIKALIETDPGNHAYWARLSNFHRRKKDYDNALNSIDRASYLRGTHYWEETVELLALSEKSDH